MDLSNYHRLIQSEVKRVRSLSQDDQDDLAQDVCVKLLETHAIPRSPRKYIRGLIRNMLIDRGRKASRRPAVVFDSYLADRAMERGGSDD